MTGEEWGEFADQLKGDTPLRKWLLEKLKKNGKTDAKANEMADQMALLASMHRGGSVCLNSLAARIS